MWFGRRRQSNPTIEQPPACGATLVVHADGELDCEEWSHCGADPGLHEWQVACADLHPACGCTGDEQPFGVELRLAA